MENEDKAPTSQGPLSSPLGAPSAPAEPLRVLVADDEESLRFVISSVLTDAGHEVVTVPSAEAALAEYEARPFPIVITDIVMGTLSGLDLLERLRQLDEDCLVIVMTSHASLDTVMTAMRHGAWDFLIKPFDDIDWIAKVVDRAADRVRLVLANRTLTEQLVEYARALEERNEALRHQAERDALTGLYNRRYLQQKLAEELTASKRDKAPLSLLFLDVDHFKVYNDTHGHLAGDRLLEELAKFLTDRFEDRGTVARYGGEEIVVLLPRTGKAEALALADDVRRDIESHPFPGRETQPEGHLTVSVGVGSFPEDGFDIRGLLGHADQAVYQAKSRGRNGVCA